MVFGLFALFADANLKHQPCGRHTHIWKYALLNVVFTFCSTASFFLFPGGGEGARARALVITIFSAGFATWGLLLWSQLTSVCSTVLRSQYQTIFSFHHLGLVHNSIIFLLMVVHEVWLGNQLKGDYTLMAEIHQKPAAPGFNGLPSSAGVNKFAPGDHQQGQQGHGVMMPPSLMNNPTSPNMSPDIMNEYKDISNSMIKSHSKDAFVTLPKSEP